MKAQFAAPRASNTSLHHNPHPSDALVKPRSVRVIEFFAGIGGVSQAWSEAETVRAFDINRNAKHVFEQNCSHVYEVREIESIRSRELRELKADVWWMSPPCQPYSRRGQQRDLTDPRSAALLRMVEAIESCRPASLALENVVGFEDSQAWQMLHDSLESQGYQIETRMICPTQLGWPNLRPRFYALASHRPLANWQPFPDYRLSLADFVRSESDRDETLNVPSQQLKKFGRAMDRVDPSDPAARAACFTASYGKKLIQSGSFLCSPSGARRFSPPEVADLMGFPPSFRLGALSNRQHWKLLGNSVSLPVVRYVLSHLSDGPKSRLPWKAP